jgi:hypothetical protein
MSAILQNRSVVRMKVLQLVLVFTCFGFYGGVAGQVADKSCERYLNQLTKDVQLVNEFCEAKHSSSHITALDVFAT